MMKKGSKAFLVILVVLSLFAFGGCIKKSGIEDDLDSGEVYPENGLPKNKKVTLSIIYPVMGFGKEYFEYGVKTFQEKFKNVKLDVRYIEGGNDAYNQIVKSAIQSGNDDEMYDWIYSFTNGVTLMSQGKLETQDELWERSVYDRPDLKMKDVIIAEKEAVFNYFNHMYVVPSGSHIYGIYFNKKLFKKLGLTEQPKDWNEFLAMCAKIKTKGVYPMVMAGKYAGPYFNFGWGAIPYEVGGDKFKQDEYNFEPNVYKSKPYVTMLKRLEEFARRGYLHPGTASYDHTQSQMEFVQGKAAMVTNGTWIANEMAEVLPEDFEWGFMAFPGNDPGQKQVVLLEPGGSGYIWKNRPELNKKWTKEFNLWLLNLDIQNKFAQAGGVPTRRDFKFESEKKELSPSVVEAWKVINRKDLKVIDNRPRVRIVSNSEMAKIAKKREDGYIAVITGQKTGEQVAREINSQYMKGLAADKRK